MEATQSKSAGIASLQILLQSGEQPRNETGRHPVGVQCQLVICRVDELQRHPIYARHHLAVPASQLSALAELGDLAFREPLIIARDRTIIDGYARWELARLNRQLTLPCIEYELTEAQTLYWLIQKHRASRGLNAFSRTLLALELEPGLKEEARSNQRAGGQQKGSSKLTEAERLDVRKQIADAASVAVGNVTKVKQLLENVHPELLEALRCGEISIHRTWKWSMESPERQTDALRSYRTEKGVNKAIRDLISRREESNLPTALDPGSLIRRLSEFEADECSAINVSVIRYPGKTIFVTEELIKSLRPRQESMPTCTRDNR